eukprot:CAMPEP_0180333432 /NCGR_PEP_ID=MMETSP0988-20121125/43100_1 /TAXON_ID=697907 /ORGANISM="non described non described, Strain CCMP2293" /LENGTH=37 /DNA_ID= /DNA_START= /DNA_END= /DNA_ORIENTATION=
MEKTFSSAFSSAFAKGKTEMKEGMSILRGQEEDGTAA